MDPSENVRNINPPKGHHLPSQFVNDFEVDYAGGKAERNIAGFKMTVRFPSNATKKEVDDYLNKFQGKSLDHIQGIIKELKATSQSRKDAGKPFKPISYTFKQNKTDDIGIIKSYADGKQKDISKPTEYYDKKLASLKDKKLTNSQAESSKKVIERKQVSMERVKLLAIYLFGSLKTEPIKPSPQPSLLSSHSVNDVKSVKSKSTRGTDEKKQEVKKTQPKIPRIWTEEDIERAGKKQGTTRKKDVWTEEDIKQLEKKQEVKPSERIITEEDLKRKHKKALEVKDRYKALGTFYANKPPVLINKYSVTAPKGVHPCDLRNDEIAFAEEMKLIGNLNSAWFARKHMKDYLSVYGYPTKYHDVSFDNFFAYHGEIEVQGRQEEVEINPTNIATLLDYKEKNHIALPIHLNRNHWGLVYIDHNTRKVEFYDSMAVNFKNVENSLQAVADQLSNFHKGEKPYKVKNKIKEPFQHDSYNCAPWMMYFLQNRLESRLEKREVEFKAPSRAEADMLIKNYRKHMIRAYLNMYYDNLGKDAFLGSK